jgi:hypothetical protein
MSVMRTPSQRSRNSFVGGGECRSAGKAVTGTALSRPHPKSHPCRAETNPSMMMMASCHKHDRAFAASISRRAPRTVSGGMKVVESWRFEIPFSSASVFFPIFN